MAVWTHIAHDSLSLPATSVTWGVATPISGAYDHLYIKATVRNDYSAYLSEMDVRLNNDSGANYSTTVLRAETSTVSSEQETGESKFRSIQVAGDSVLAKSYSSVEIWIPHYSNDTNFKQAICQANIPNTSVDDNEWSLTFSAQLWADTPAAIVRIDLIASNSGDWMADSVFDLYGIKGV